jgi:flagellin
MGLSILSNIPSLEAQNQLSMTNMSLQNTLFQLSSGSKINSGADDPAGLSIADGLEANISALTQSAQNVTDGVGLLQTADGALSQVTSLLNRAVTLATEGGNAGLTTAQQTALQNEYTSITNEINQIGSNTTYNNTPVFTGAALSVFLSDGSASDAVDPTISVTMPTLSASAIGLGTYATATLDLSSQPAAANTVTIGTQTYTFVAAASDLVATTANQVVIGSSVQATLQNLQAAVNGAAGAGTTFSAATVQNSAAQISNVNGGSATVQAVLAGTAGNSIAVSATFTSNAGAWAGGVTDLAGGTAAATLNTAASSQSALASIQAAISTVAADRGAIGAGINQMNAALDVINNTSQNLSSSLSGIQDANMGQVVANLSKYQVLEQTGIAALAQANTNEQAVLKLLQ